MKSTNDMVLTLDEEEWVASNVICEIVAGLGESTLMADAEPVLLELK